MSDDNIRNLPKHRKTLEETNAIIAASKVARFFSPLMPKSVRKALAKVDPSELESVRDKMEHLANVPDRFNTQFAKRGWVMLKT